MTDTLTFEDAASTDLIEAPDQGQEVVTHDPGTLEPTSRGDDLTLEQATDLVDETTPAEVATADDAGVVVQINDKPVTLDELVEGYIESQNCKHTLADLHGRYDQVVSAANDVAWGASSLADHLTTLIAPKPHPALAMTNPQAHIQQQAMHEQGMGAIATILEHAQLARRQAGTVNVERHQHVVALQMEKLIEHFPDCAAPEGREQFFDRVREVAYHVDFTEAELRMATDHRLFRLAHLAAKQFAHEQRRPRTLKELKPKRRVRQSNAMERLTQSGSFRDAMAIDVD